MCTGRKKAITASGITALHLFMLFSTILLVPSACTPQQKEGGIVRGKIQVVTSIEPLSYFIEQVGGEHVDVAVMVPPGANPHTYDPRPDQMVALEHARLFVEAGSGIEFELDWMKKFSSLNPHMEIRNASQGIELVAREENRHGHEHGHAHQHGKIDPHFWLSPRNGILIARNIERALAAIDPKHQAEYAANRKALETELDALSSEIAAKLANTRMRTFMVFHPAWGYFADEFNLQQIAAERQGKELTPKAMQDIIRQAKEHGIRVIFVSPTFSTLQAESLAREIGGIILPIDPLSGDYIDNLRRVADAFAASMP